MQRITRSLLISMLFFSGPTWAEAELAGPETMAPYLRPDAPTFDMTISQFRQQYNALNPHLFIGEYRTVDAPGNKNDLTFAASGIMSNLYSSTALERGTGKIKTLQITWIPQPGLQDNLAYASALSYMTALLHFFSPALSEQESANRINNLLKKGKGSPCFMQTEGALRFVVADHGDEGLTFAIEPIKLSMMTH